jgi:hypothetical protein
MHRFLIQREGEGKSKRTAKGQASKPVKLQSPGKGHRVQSLLEEDMAARLHRQIKSARGAALSVDGCIAARIFPGVVCGKLTHIA